MHESFIARATVIAILLWSVTALLIAAVWGLALEDVGPRWSRPIAVMTCVSACSSAVAHIHAGQIRLCAVIRATAGLKSDGPSPVRALK